MVRVYQWIPYNEPIFVDGALAQVAHNRYVVHIRDCIFSLENLFPSVLKKVPPPPLSVSLSLSLSVSAIKKLTDYF